MVRNYLLLFWLWQFSEDISHLILILIFSYSEKLSDSDAIEVEVIFIFQFHLEFENISERLLNDNWIKRRQRDRHPLKEEEEFSHANALYLKLSLSFSWFLHTLLELENRDYRTGRSRKHQLLIGRVKVKSGVSVSVSINSLIRNSRVRKIHTTYNTVNMTTYNIVSFADGYFFGQKLMTVDRKLDIISDMLKVLAKKTFRLKLFFKNLILLKENYLILMLTWFF